MKPDFNTFVFEQRFTKTNDALKFIAHLEQIDLSKIDYRDLGILIDKYFPLIPIPTTKIHAGQLLFRARINENKKPFTKIADITIPPKKATQNFGRANIPNEPILYVSSNLKLAAYEIIQNYKYNFRPEIQIPYLTVGVWKIKTELHTAHIVHSPKLHSLRKDIFEAFTFHKNLMNNGVLQEDTVIATNLISQFFSDQFTKETIQTENDYKISAFYSERVKQANTFISPHYSKEKFDGLTYPSVANRFIGDNIAIFKESIEEKLELIDALQLVCYNINFEKASFQTAILHNAKSTEGGIITWNQEIFKPQ